MANIGIMKKFVIQFVNIPGGINDSFRVINRKKINVRVLLPCCYGKEYLKAFMQR